VLHQIDPARIAAAFEPATKRTQPSPRAYDLQIVDLKKLKDATLDGALRYAGKAMAADFESRAEALLEQIEELRKLRNDAAAAERARPHLPTTQTAIGTVAALAAKLAGSTAEERTALRTSTSSQ
jgi:hypothetical protein